MCCVKRGKVDVPKLRLGGSNLIFEFSSIGRGDCNENVCTFKVGWPNMIDIGVWCMKMHTIGLEYMESAYLAK